MDESEYFLREFVKARQRNQVTKIKLKKVVSDIILAQKVRRFIVGIHRASQKTSDPSHIKRRPSVRLVSPRISKTPKYPDSRRNISDRRGASDTKRPSLGLPQATPSVGICRTPLLTVSSDSRRSSENNANASMFSRRHSQTARRASNHSAPMQKDTTKMPKINFAPVHSPCQAKSPSFKLNKPQIRVQAAGADKPEAWPRAKTSLPALPDSLWAGDPKAIGSVRRPRKNAREMLAEYKSGEESRRVLRNMTFPCTRNCHKPDILVELERMYAELPSLGPAVEKAREDMARKTADYPANAGTHRPSVGLLSVPGQSAISRDSSLGSGLSSKRQNSVQFQSPTVRPHGQSLRQHTSTGLRVRY